MKILSNKIFIGSICILLAAVLSFLILPGINKSKNTTIKAQHLKTAVSAGVQITEDMIEEKEIGSFGLSDKVIKKKDEIVGKFAVKSVTPDEVLISSMFSDYVVDERLDKIAANGQKLITVSLNTIAAGIGNNVTAGDIISILCYSDNEVKVFDELKNIEVYSIQNDDAQNLDEAKNDEEAEHIASTVTLIATDIQTQRLVYAEYSGKLHAVLEKRGVIGE